MRYFILLLLTSCAVDNTTQVSDSWVCEDQTTVTKCSGLGPTVLCEWNAVVYIHPNHGVDYIDDEFLCDKLPEGLEIGDVRLCVTEWKTECIRRLEKGAERA